MMKSFQNSKISSNLDSKVLILFWQFTIRTLEELDIVSNQNLTIEMFLIRLMHLSSFKPDNDKMKNIKFSDKIKNKEIVSDLKIDPVNQIKNVIQEKIKHELQSEIKK